MRPSWVETAAPPPHPFDLGGLALAALLAFVFLVVLVVVEFLNRGES